MTSNSSGVGIILISRENFTTKTEIKFIFPTINNEAEYEAILAGLKLAIELEVANIDIFSDSKLVVKQDVGKFNTSNDRIFFMWLE